MAPSSKQRRVVCPSIAMIIGASAIKALGQMSVPANPRKYSTPLARASRYATRRLTTGGETGDRARRSPGHLCDRGGHVVQLAATAIEFA